MFEDKYSKLTNALYKIIEFFPEEDPLKNKTKEKALEVMEGLVKQSDSEQVLKDIDVLKGYLMVGKSQGWIDNINFLILSKEYDKVKEEIGSVAEVMQRGTGLLEETKEIPFSKNKGEIKEKTDIPQNSISDRQEKILKILEEQGKAQVGDLKKVFSEVSKRTLRRDLDNLLKKKIVVRTGEWNQVVYKLNGDRTGVLS